MSITFSPAELVNIAIANEHRGISFYDVMAKSADSDEAKSVFQKLADMEREHIRIFEGMLGEAKNHLPPEAGTFEYAGYLQALIDSAVFTDEMITSELATQADSDTRALELGINAEKDSILFYYQLRDLMPHGMLHLIDRVIAEEKGHLHQLSDIRKRLSEAQ
jgi:rubrerythrin